MLIDTNIFLELLSDQEKADQCEEFLEKVHKGCFNCITASFTVHAVEGILSDDLESVKDFISTIEGSIGLEVIETGLEQEREAVGIGRKENLDFDDALHLKIGREKDVDGIVSFDTDFEKTELNRIEPRELIPEKEKDGGDE